MDRLTEFFTSVTHTYVPQNFQLYHQGQLLKSEKKIAETSQCGQVEPLLQVRVEYSQLVGS